LDKFFAFMTNLFRYELVDQTVKGLLLRVYVGEVEHLVWLPRRHVTLLPDDQVMIPQWLCQQARLVEHGNTIRQP
jgi:hypothetical protein